MGTGCGTAVLAGLRSLGVFVAMAVIGLGAWVIHTVNDVKASGGSTLELTRMDPNLRDSWRAFFDGVVASQIRIWCAVAGSCFTFLAGLFILLSLKTDRLKVSRYVVVPLEVLSVIIMAGAFAASISLALKLDPLCADLDSSPSTNLIAFHMLCPLSKGVSIASGVGGFVLAITALAAVIETCHHARKQKVCSFEPTASALGMSHGYQAVIPPIPRADIPTLYNPLKPIPGAPPWPLSGGGEGKGVVDAGAGMGRRDSGLSIASRETESEISGPLGLEKPDAVKQMRPVRPWSEAPKRR